MRRILAAVLLASVPAAAAEAAVPIPDSLPTTLPRCQGSPATGRPMKASNPPQNAQAAEQRPQRPG